MTGVQGSHRWDKTNVLTAAMAFQVAAQPGCCRKQAHEILKLESRLMLAIQLLRARQAPSVTSPHITHRTYSISPKSKTKISIPDGSRPTITLDNEGVIYCQTLRLITIFDSLLPLHCLKCPDAQAQCQYA